MDSATTFTTLVTARSRMRTLMSSPLSRGRLSTTCSLNRRRAFYQDLGSSLATRTGVLSLVISCSPHCHHHFVTIEKSSYSKIYIRYRERGIPYTLGFLLHGLPGCGKTSTIKVSITSNILSGPRLDHPHTFSRKLLLIYRQWPTTLSVISSLFH